MSHSSTAPAYLPVPLLTPVPYSHPDARRLTRTLHQEQVALYGFADDPDETPECDFDPANGLFVIAHFDSVAVGCGGWRLVAPHTAEIKRMYVATAARGRGLGRHILDHLEQQAGSRGVSRFVLETGARNEAALALYRASGYRLTSPYVPGRNPEVNRAMIKQVAAARSVS
ncbi:GNAT family N-acetyltransferase [Streptomyces sp. 4N509B]|uniref:GNAT family N-acetyltransferase n=1 Tax=Streptomyces sp. 4N509B TaxID=3457413 RepID=UPI003FD3FC5D